MTQSSDAFVVGQRGQWDQASQGWAKWAEVFSQRNDGEMYLELAGIRPGHRVLEVGAGTGDQTLLLARAVGPDGRVVATDLSPQMLDIARSRVEAAGHTNVAFAAGDAASLELDEDGFDAAVAGFVLMFFPDPAAGAGNIGRLLAPGGRLAASVWSAAPAVPMLSLPMMAALGIVGGPPPDPTAPGLFALADRSRLAGVLTSAGFAEVQVTPFVFQFGFPSAADYTNFIREVAPPISQLIDSRAPDKADAVWQKVEAEAAAHAAADGVVTFENEMLFVSGRRP